MDLTDSELLRYSRQIMLPDFGIEAQDRLLACRALVIGAGGLGSAAAIYLAAAGIGGMIIADHDAVDLSNLQRQILHGTPDLGRPKVDSARERLHAINPTLEINALPARLEGVALERQVREADIVIDASDNFTTRFAVNAACVLTGTPLVSGAAIRYEGQLTVFRSDLGTGPCYHCLYQEGVEEEQTCAENGILAPVVGVIGSLQALEAVKALTGIGETLCGRLLLFDGKHLEWRTVALKRDPACRVCSTRQAL
jgi:adenylyltransferase/sulfurtransferase